MFEAAEIGRKVKKSDFNEAVRELRPELLAAQRQARREGVPIFLLINGVPGAGKGELTNQLLEWLDSRGVHTHVFWDETDEEKQRPRWWRYWRSMPKAGEISILFGGWYEQLIQDQLAGEVDHHQAGQEIERIKETERMLIADGALIIKFWFHLSQEEQAQRIQERRKDPQSHWAMAPETVKAAKHYEPFIDVASRIVRETDTGEAPWYLIEATDRYYRDLTAGKTLLRAMQTHFERPAPSETMRVSHAPAIPHTEEAQITILDRVDSNQQIKKSEYRERKAKLQSELNALGWQAFRERQSVVCVFEGWDASGKGGSIRRLVHALDARLYRVLPVAAPNDEESAHHYLWRFWRNIPRDGYWAIFDRSWYGRVLVERVEQFATQAEWGRSYHEINTFEAQLAEHNVVLLKFWLDIDKQEQLQRFKAREVTPHKQHKITDEDWRNRERWDDYKRAVNEMVIRTSTEYAPWHIVPANDKRFARIEVLQKTRDALVKALKKGEKIIGADKKK